MTLLDRLNVALDVLQLDADAFRNSNSINGPGGELDEHDAAEYADYVTGIEAVREAAALIQAPQVYRWRRKDRIDARWTYQEEPFAWPSDEIEVEALCRVPG